ncbi:hypothetical protein [Endozoicomonas sp. SCSIO W0465]|uniref:hypothetical protein n=1 Tax=Endozoicomonas sp. SCSIO W0465 TaxID=2918516 RepID=UPI002074CB30|nr:hypothetical protein [Endozoicomonas sp. SCSIO W0465]USE34577.1 hypothetical protein MJO57_20875 [Endozoicomonas sp. SCSIO W0465]
MQGGKGLGVVVVQAEAFFVTSQYSSAQYFSVVVMACRFFIVWHFQPRSNVVRVRNINGTSDHDCRCGSWLKHWELFSKEKASLCVEESCTNEATVGAHVQKISSYDNDWYIIPLCKHHNNLRGEEIELYGSPTLVSANVSETCGG